MGVLAPSVCIRWQFYQYGYSDVDRDSTPGDEQGHWRLALDGASHGGSYSIRLLSWTPAAERASYLMTVAGGVFLTIGFSYATSLAHI